MKGSQIARTPVPEHPLAERDAVAAVVRLDIGVDPPWRAVAYLLIPKQRDRGVVIYQQGHLHGGRWSAHDAQHDRAVVNHLLKAGVTVAYLGMPLNWENPRPKFGHRRFGELSIETHEQLRLLEGERKRAAVTVLTCGLVLEVATARG